MLKSEELSDPNSCFNKANDNELIFVLLGRDPAAAKTVRGWCVERLRLKKNKVDDPQIREAFAWAHSVDELHKTDDAKS